MIDKAQKGDIILCITPSGNKTKVCSVRNFMVKDTGNKFYYSRAILTEKSYKVKSYHLFVSLDKK